MQTLNSPTRPVLETRAKHGKLPPECWGVLPMRGSGETMEDRAVAAARDRSLAACYGEMRGIARRLLRSASDRLLLQPTELAHEAAIRLLALDPDRFESRAHMLATAARITRRALIDEARAARALKRQPPALMTMWPDEPRPVTLETLDAAVLALAQVSADHARIVELRFTLGMTVEEVAASEGLSERTVKRRWAAARAWLQQHIEAVGDD